MASSSKIWVGLNTVSELAKMADIPAPYVHPLSQQCSIPEATTEHAGLMSAADKRRLSTISYSWTELGEYPIDNKNADTAQSTTSVSYDIITGLDLWSNLITRLEFDTSLNASASGNTNGYATTAKAVVNICGYEIIDTEPGSGYVDISARVDYSGPFTIYLLPTSVRNEFNIYLDQTFSETVSTTSDLQISATASIGSFSIHRKTIARIDGGTLRVYAVQ